MGRSHSPCWAFPSQLSHRKITSQPSSDRSCVLEPVVKFCARFTAIMNIITKHPQANIGCLLLIVGIFVKLASGNTPVRLVNGEKTDTTLTGRLEVFFAGMWGSVCDVGLGVATAKTVCGFLGYSRGYGILTGGYGKGTGPIWLKDLKCMGSETDVTQCSRKAWGNVDDCTHYSDVALVCSNVTSASETYELRLAGGDKTESALTGRLEVFFSGTWGTVCSDSTLVSTAEKLCGFLGYSRGYSVSEDNFGKENGPIWLGNVVCAGNETDISQCSADPWGSPACMYELDTFLMCSNVPQASEKYDITLIDGERTSSSRSGRLEVFYNGVWGAVCDDDTPNNDTAETFCGFLGYRRGYAMLDSLFGERTGPVWLCNVKCRGKEKDVSGCAHDGWGNRAFDFMNNVVLVCSNVPEASETYEMRLVGGEKTTTSASGRVEVLYGGIWGTVCVEGVSDLTVTTLCGFLGYSRGYTSGYTGQENYKEDNAPMWLSDLSCTQKDANISQCSHQPWGVYVNYLCDSIYGMPLFCSNAPTAADTYELRLVNGEKTATTISGRLEVFYSGAWGTVCGDSFTSTSAVTICRFLGYSRGYVQRNGLFGGGTGPIWLSNVKCSGDEPDISQCAHDPWGRTPCYHTSDVGLVCTNQSTETYPLRLVGGKETATSLTGRLEVFFGGAWGTICDEDYSFESTNTLCRFLGYRYGHPLIKAYEETEGPIWVGGIGCVGNETNISQCQHSGWGKHNCYHENDIGLACSNVAGMDEKLQKTVKLPQF